MLLVYLAIISIALAVAVMEISVSLVQGFQDAIKQKIIGFVSHVQVGGFGFTENMSVEVNPISDSSGLQKRIAALPYVQSVSPYIMKWTMIESAENTDVLMLKGIDSKYDWRFFSRSLKAGKLPDFTKNDESLEILISRIQAQKLNLKVGDKAKLLFIQDPIKRRPVKVAGIYDTGLEEFDAIILFCDIRLIRNVMGWGKTDWMGLEVDLTSENHLEARADSINLMLDSDLEAVAVTQIPDYAPIFEWLKLQHQNVWVILILMVIVALINMTSVVLILMIERTRTIGILRSIGMKISQLQMVFIWNIAFLTLLGVIAGNVLGLGLLALQSHFQIVKLDPENYFLDFVPVAWEWNKFLWINIGTILICSIFMYLPTLAIARITPVKALKLS